MIEESLEVCSGEVCAAPMQIVPKSARPIGAPYSTHKDGPKLHVFWQMVQCYALSVPDDWNIPVQNTPA